jgi:hypothetical protein
MMIDITACQLLSTITMLDIDPKKYHHCDSSFDLWILIIPRGIFKLFLQNKVTGCMGSELSKAEFLCRIQWRWKMCEGIRQDFLQPIEQYIIVLFFPLL